MKLEEGKTYIFSIQIGNKLLTYTGEVKEVDSNFIRFVDKYNEEFSYNITSIISFKEVKNAK